MGGVSESDGGWRAAEGTRAVRLRDRVAKRWKLTGGSNATFHGLSAIYGFNLRVGRYASSRKGIPACDPLQQLISGIHPAPFA